MHLFSVTSLSAALVLTSSLYSANASSLAEDLSDALSNGETYMDLRYRYEFSDQATAANNGHASTMRTRVGYKTGGFKDFSGVIEFEDIRQIASDNYNDTLNGRTDHGLVLDLEATAVNQGFLQYSGIEDTRLRIGRERIILDNQRFVGSANWRQNDQTFDAFSLRNSSLNDTNITYAHLSSINRILGADSPNGEWDSDSHILNVKYTGLPFNFTNFSIYICIRTCLFNLHFCVCLHLFYFASLFLTKINCRQWWFRE